MRALIASLALWCVLSLVSGAARAQTAITADWTNLALGNFDAVSSGATLSAGPRTITITHSTMQDGGMTASYTAPELLGYYTGQIGSQTGPLLYSFNNTSFDQDDVFESIFTFDQAVPDLAFTISDVDRSNNSGGRHHDGVIIEYDTGNGVWQSVADTGALYTIDTSFVETRTINGVRGFRGVSTSNLTSTNGDIAVDLSSVAGGIERLRITYTSGRNSSQTPGNGNTYIGLSDFTFTQNVATSDLSLAKGVSDTAPASGSALSYTLTLTNSGPDPAAAVTVRDVLPTGFAYTGSSATAGSYDPGTQLWSLTNLPPGQSRVLTINGTASAPAGTSVTNIAEIAGSSSYDADSAPDNGAAAEDDYASVTFTTQGVRTAGTPPVLSCPAGTTVFDWDGIGWAAGMTSNSYTLANVGSIDFAISNEGTWMNNAGFGGLSPTNVDRASAGSANNGGIADSENSLHQLIDFANRDQVAATVITLGREVPGVQFIVFDVDFAANDFADKLTVTGRRGGTAVLPELTNGTVNYVVGNTAIGDGGSGPTSGDGNVTVTFDSPVDTITITYGNANTAPAIPDGQAISIHDISVCDPVATLSVSKTSAVFSGATYDYNVPGSDVIYLLNVTNTGAGTTTADTIFMVDSMPFEAAFFTGDANGSAAGTDNVYFTDDASGLSWTYATDVGFSSGGAKPANMSECSYTPSGAYDANVRYICLNPKGAMAGASGGTVPGFTIGFRARIE